MKTDLQVVVDWAETAAEILQAKERNWAWLARRMGIARQTLSLCVLGKRALTVGERSRIAHILEVPEAILFPKDR